MGAGTPCGPLVIGAAGQEVVVVLFSLRGSSGDNLCFIPVVSQRVGGRTNRRARFVSKE